MKESFICIFAFCRRRHLCSNFLKLFFACFVFGDCFLFCFFDHKNRITFTSDLTEVLNCVILLLFYKLITNTKLNFAQNSDTPFLHSHDDLDCTYVMLQITIWGFYIFKRVKCIIGDGIASFPY